MSLSDKEWLARIGMTEEEADRRAEEFENDTWGPSEWGRPRRGRPPLSEEGVRPYTVRFPVALMTYVDEEAYAHGVTRSEELRAIVAESREHRRGVA